MITVITILNVTTVMSRHYLQYGLHVEMSKVVVVSKSVWVILYQNLYLDEFH